MGDYSWTAVGEHERTGGFPLQLIHALRDRTKIGETIKFRSDRYYEEGLSGNSGKPRIIEAKVIEKYPNVFALDNGETYSWVDYMLGKQKL